MDELEKAQNLLAETAQLAKSDPTLIRVCQKLSRKIKADLQFLQRHRHKTNTNTHDLTSSNVPYLSGVLRVIKESNQVQDVICDMRKYGIIVDVICDNGKTWKKVIARNPQSLHLIWAGKGQYGTKDVVQKSCKYADCAKLHSEISPPQVVCVFCNGVTYDMAEALESKGILVDGERVDVSQEVVDKLVGVFAESSDDSDSDDNDYKSFGAPNQMNLSPPSSLSIAEALPLDQAKCIEEIRELPSNGKVFLDITTMLVYISDVCNGGCEFEFTEKILLEQAAAERRGSALKTILPNMTDRLLVTCQSAMDDYWGIVNVMAGEEETRRARELSDRITVVADTMSARFASLGASGQIKERSKVIFGTADCLKCEILTSNEGFVRAAAAQDIHIPAILHQPRALSEQKKVQGSKHSQ